MKKQPLIVKAERLLLVLDALSLLRARCGGFEHNPGNLHPLRVLGVLKKRFGVGPQVVSVCVNRHLVGKEQYMRTNRDFVAANAARAPEDGFDARTTVLAGILSDQKADSGFCKFLWAICDGEITASDLTT